MKKYITIAALLAAGSAFANATETLTFSTAPKYNGTEGGSYAGISFNLGAADATRFSVTEGKLTEYVKLQSITLLERGGNDLATDRILYITDTNNTYLGASSVFTKASESDECVFSFGGLKISSTATYYAYLITSSGDDSWTVGKTTVSSGQYYSGQLAAAGGSLSTSEAVNWGLLNGQKATASSAYAPVMDIVVTPIPEPSAFGLLAGLGALALVGTRRRRR